MRAPEAPARALVKCPVSHQAVLQPREGGVHVALQLHLRAQHRQPSRGPRQEQVPCRRTGGEHSQRDKLVCCHYGTATKTSVAGTTASSTTGIGRVVIEMSAGGDLERGESRRQMGLDLDETEL